MPYPARRFGRAEIVALCDQAITEPMAEGFPDPPAGGWEPIVRDYPDHFAGAPDLWNAHTHCFLVRMPDAVILACDQVAA